MTPLEEAQEYAVELVHEHGAATTQILHEQICRFWTGVEVADLDELQQVYADLEEEADLYVSTLNSSRAALTIRALRGFGIDDLLAVRGGLVRALGGSRTVPKERIKDVAQYTLDLLLPIADACDHEVNDSEMESDLALVELLREAPGGVKTRGELEQIIADDDRIDPAPLSLTYSPLIELVANGLFGIRGAQIDIAAVEASRPHRRGPWSRWGRLDRNRTWVEAKTSGAQLKVRLPRDCLEVLGLKKWRLWTTAGGHLAELTIENESSFAAHWKYTVPTDWEQEEHVAILEFDRRHGSVHLFSGTTAEGLVDPRFADGCVLIGGRWSYCYTVQNSDASAAVAVSTGVSGLTDLAVGARTTLTCDGHTMTVAREPHCHRLEGLEGIVDLEHNSFVRLDFTPGRIKVAAAMPTNDPMQQLLRSCGVFEPTERPWARIGSALGIGQADRRQVRRILAERQRFDLAATTGASHDLTAAPTRRITSEEFAVDGAVLTIERTGRRWAAEQRVGSGSLGLAWTHWRTHGSVGDHSWAQQSLMVVRAWSAATALGEAVLERSDHGWVGPGGDEPVDLRSALTRLSELDGWLNEDVLDSHEAMVPLTSLGYVLLFRRADTELRRLVITAAAWLGSGAGYTEDGPTPLRALSAGHVAG